MFGESFFTSVLEKQNCWMEREEYTCRFLGHTNLIYSLTDLADPNISKIKIISQKKVRFFSCRVLTIKKKHYILFTGPQKMEKARKWSQELFAFSFVVPSFQSHRSLTTAFINLL